MDGYGEQPHIVFEATGVYSRPLERFMKENNYRYCLLNPLEAKLQCDSLRMHIEVMHINWRTYTLRTKDGLKQNQMMSTDN